jgi:hypothetical protein
VAGDRRWVLEQMPTEAAEREYAALLAMERRGVPAVRPAGLVKRPGDGHAVLVTEDLTAVVPWQSLLRQLVLRDELGSAPLGEAVALFLVEIHRQGVLWGDGSLSALLFRRDGKALQPFLAVAGTTQVVGSLTGAQRRDDLEAVQDQLARELGDLAVGVAQPGGHDHVALQTRRLLDRYIGRWQALHEPPTIPFDRRSEVVAEVSRIHQLGYAVEEVQLVGVTSAPDEVLVHVTTGSRQHHAAEFARLTGSTVGQGQAAALLDELDAHRRAQPETPVSQVIQSWLGHVVRPTLQRLQDALPASRDVVQDYCDLLEVRWLLSERAGHDVGDDVALRALEQQLAPADSAVLASAAETPDAWWGHARGLRRLAVAARAS